MKKILFTLVVLILSVNSAFAQNTQITFANEITHTYTPTGETTAVTVRALDINGLNLFSEAHNPTITLGGTHTLEILHKGAIEGSTQQQIIAKFPLSIKAGSYSLSATLAASTSLTDVVIGGLRLFLCPKHVRISNRSCQGLGVHSTCLMMSSDGRASSEIQCPLVGRLVGRVNP